MKRPIRKLYQQLTYAAFRGRKNDSVEFVEKYK